MGRKELIVFIFIFYFRESRWWIPMMKIEMTTAETVTIIMTPEITMTPIMRVGIAMTITTIKPLGIAMTITIQMST